MTPILLDLSSLCHHSKDDLTLTSRDLEHGGSMSNVG